MVICYFLLEGGHLLETINRWKAVHAAQGRDLFALIYGRMSLLEIGSTVQTFQRSYCTSGTEQQTFP